MSDLSAAVAGTKITCRTQFGQRITMREVTRITDAQVVCGQTRFRKRDGLLLGEGDHRYGHLASDADILAERISTAQLELGRIVLTEQTLADAESLIARCAK